MPCPSRLITAGILDATACRLSQIFLSRFQSSELTLPLNAALSGACHGQDAGGPVQACDAEEEGSSSQGGTSSDQDRAGSDPGSDLEEPDPVLPPPSNLDAGPGDDSSDDDSSDSAGFSDAEEELAAEDPGSDDEALNDADQGMLGDQPAWPGSDMTVNQFTYAAMSMKTDSRQSNRGFNAWLKFYKLTVSPGKPNNIPASLYRCNSIMGVKKLAAYTWHSCPCGQHSYDPRAPQSAADKCPRRGCRVSRWKDPATTGPLIPRQVWIDL